MLDLKIAAMELVVHPPGSRNAVLASFTVNLGPIRISSCAIVKNEDGSIGALIPRSRYGGKVVKFRDHDDFETFNQLALAAYASLLRCNEPRAKTRQVEDAVEDALALAGL
ncbi:hypothetical protein ACK6D9_12210 [Hoeflea sp. Naph1]|uniref:hypothetical protein n=1 Tax=Hoeflea sp. Naph1 TaxID=3388653 RepID=UPI0039902CA1